MKRKPSDEGTTTHCEVECTEGLEFVTEAELRETLGNRVRLLPSARRGEVRFRYQGDLNRLRSLKTAQAAYSVQTYDIPRPRALLGDAHLRRFVAQIDEARRQSPVGVYHTFSIAAAGSESSVMERIKEAIASETGLNRAPDKGDLHIRIRPSPGAGQGWETLVRLSPRPLVTRSWRVCDREGALNAATAHAMIRLAAPKAEMSCLNLGAGSGTLLIERLAFSDASLVVGVDNDDTALTCTRTNIAASGCANRIRLLKADMTRLPVGDGTFDQVYADLPFGQLVGSHRHNLKLYPAVLREAARVTRRDGCFVVITHEMKLMDRLLREDARWRAEQSIQVNLRGLHPRIYVLRRV